MSLTDRARLALNLKVAREARGISQTAAAVHVGKTRGTIVNWENPKARAEPDSDEVATLATLYGVTSRDLRFAELERQPALPRQAAASQAAIIIPSLDAPGAGSHTTPEDQEADAIQAEKDRAAAAARRRKRKAAGDH